MKVLWVLAGFLLICVTTPIFINIGWKKGDDVSSSSEVSVKGHENVTNGGNILSLNTNKNNNKDNLNLQQFSLLKSIRVKRKVKPQRARDPKTGRFVKKPAAKPETPKPKPKQQTFRKKTPTARRSTLTRKPNPPPRRPTHGTKGKQHTVKNIRKPAVHHRVLGKHGKSAASSLPKRMSAVTTRRTTRKPTTTKKTIRTTKRPSTTKKPIVTSKKPTIVNRSQNSKSKVVPKKPLVKPTEQKVSTNSVSAPKSNPSPNTVGNKPVEPSKKTVTSKKVVPKSSTVRRAITVREKRPLRRSTNKLSSRNKLTLARRTGAKSGPSQKSGNNQQLEDKAEKVVPNKNQSGTKTTTVSKTEKDTKKPATPRRALTKQTKRSILAKKVLAGRSCRAKRTVGSKPTSGCGGAKVDKTSNDKDVSNKDNDDDNNKESQKPQISRQNTNTDSGTESGYGSGSDSDSDSASKNPTKSETREKTPRRHEERAAAREARERYQAERTAVTERPLTNTSPARKYKHPSNHPNLKLPSSSTPVEKRPFQKEVISDVHGEKIEVEHKMSVIDDKNSKHYGLTRVDEVEFSLNPKIVGHETNVTPKMKEQNLGTKAGGVNHGKGLIAGHIIPAALHGPNNKPWNVFPQAAGFNNGEWKKVENVYRKHSGDGQNRKVSFKFEYADKSTNVPTGFSFKVTPPIPGHEDINKYYSNSDSPAPGA